ncbi:MAG: glutamate racemase [Acidimicrobiales bacterium]|nr:glutamate racemase [Acidimicrobiales bacterium]MDP6297998.1 glutamate racemase [Acidimicrobiales bacterium]HJM28451.1 glutamate racemase [Acidimicrobiales bacterium]HJM96974.1 glutamate racemase [Acidimicrobiales bacterium]
MSNQRPIGIFDSGFGGLTVARAVIDLLPEEDVVYFGDTARYPYGPQPLEQVREYAEQITNLLISKHDVKMVVIACNTAAAAALGSLGEALEIPVVGVIEPGAQAVIEVSRRKRIGVIGTVGTISSGAYQKTIEEIAGINAEVTCIPCPGFVEFVERGESSGEQIQILAQRLLAPIVEADVDALLLGCTHYPYLARTIGSTVGESVVLVSSADETAFAVAKILKETNLETSQRKLGNRTFISTGDVSWFAELGQRLFGPELESAESHEWSTGS